MSISAVTPLSSPAPTAAPTAAAKPAAPASPAPTTASAAPAKKQSVAASVRQATADSLRGIGAGYAEQGQMSAAVVDMGFIYPIESVYAAGRLYKEGTKNVPLLKKTGGIATVAGFLASYQNLIASSLISAPSEVVGDITHAAADQIDGKKTFDNRLGTFGLDAFDE